MHQKLDLRPMTRGTLFPVNWSGSSQ